MGEIVHCQAQFEAVAQALEQALRPVPQCVFVVDLQGLVLSANHAAFTRFGKLEQELIGRRIVPKQTLDEPAQAECFSQEWEGMATLVSSTGFSPSFAAQVQVIRDANDQPLLALCLPHAHPGMPSLLTTPAAFDRQADLTQRIQRMDSVSTLAGGISHEFNNLLTGIMGYTELLAGRLDNDSVARDYADQIRRAAAEASELTRQIGLFSQGALFSLEEVDLHEVLAAALGAVANGAAPGVRFLDRSAPAPAITRGDRAHLEQAFLALLRNACEAMPAGGAVTTEIEPVTLDAHLAREIGLAREGQFSRITILDEGEGMDPAIQRQATEPFFSTKQRPHAGLGLSTACGIIQKHHGAIQLSSTPGCGTAVRVFLPAAKAAVKNAGPIVPSLGEPATVLLVEDEEIPRELQAHVLQSAGYAVLAAADGQEGLDLFREYGTQIHLVITDIMMPRMTGDVLVAELRKFGLPVRVMAISGYSRGEAVDRLHRLGVDAFVPKPFTGQGLLEHVRQVLATPAATS